MFVTLISLLLCISSAMCATQDSAVRSLVYTDINVNSYDKCARLMNGTSQIGCQSTLEGDVGVLFHVNQSDDISKVITGKHPPYIVLIHADYFSKASVKLYQSSGKVRGILVYSNENYTGRLSGWSPELKCPRQHYGLYNSTYGSNYAKCENNPWNPIGDGLTEEDINFPIFIMKNDTASQMMIDCHDQHNLDGDYPLCAAQMKSRMDGAQSTETCIRRNNLQNNLSPAQYCDVIGGHTIVGTLQATNSSTENPKPVILITSALDSRSFEMTSSSPGANSLTGFVSLLAVAQALGSLNNTVKENMPYDIIFVLFDGEAFDNMGSVRMVYDMSKDSFPFKKKEGKWQPRRINISQIKYIIEIGQVGHINKTAYLHFDPLSASNSSIRTDVSAIIGALKTSGASASIKFRNQSGDNGLIPSSLQSILKAGNVSGIVITDFDKKYTNRYYNSRFDTPDKLGIKLDGNTTESYALPLIQPLAQKIVNLSNAIAKAVYRLATNQALSTIHRNEDEITKILYCYYYNPKCGLVRSLLDSNIKKYSYVFNQYVGVYSSNMRNNAYIARNLLAYFLRTEETTIVNKTDQCKSQYAQDEIYKYLAFKRNTTYECLRFTVYDTDGRSPSAAISNYNYAGGAYSAWSESRWQKTAFHLSIFLVQDSVSQGMILFCGLLMFFSSFIIMYIIHKKSHILFQHSQI
uniref:nicastrin-like n=1 Tax=Styela clava TaxID=7725 RepID=UPI00193A8D17|nr:nicastrin-like [Styela clava]